MTEARSELDTALALDRNVPNYATQRDWLDLLDADANLERVAGDIARAMPLREAACKRLEISTGLGSTLTRRCDAELAWLRAIAAPDNTSVAAAFDSAAAAYAATLPEHHLGRLDLTLLGAELDAAAGRPTRPQIASAREQWRAIVGGTPPIRISELH